MLLIIKKLFSVRGFSSDILVVVYCMRSFHVYIDCYTSHMADTIYQRTIDIAIII